MTDQPSPAPGAQIAVDTDAGQPQWCIRIRHTVEYAAIVPADSGAEALQALTVRLLDARVDHAAVTGHAGLDLGPDVVSVDLGTGQPTVHHYHADRVRDPDRAVIPPRCG